MRHIIKGGLHFLFLYVIERCRWRSVLPWLHFIDLSLRLYAFYSLQNQMHTPPQKVLWWTGGSCSDETSLPGWRI